MCELTVKTKAANNKKFTIESAKNKNSRSEME